jgi:hypothetical protein
VKAAVSAGSSSAQGATILAGSVGAAAAGLAVGTKILIVAFIVGLLSGGIGLAAVINNQEEDLTTRGYGNGSGNGGNGTSGGSSGGMENGTTTCPVGEVLSVLEDISLGLNCTSAVGICEEWQEAMGGECVDCYTGQVSVRDPSTDIPTHTSCISCSSGRVRSSADGNALGSCTRAVGICQPWETADGGLCAPCSTGQVSLADSEGALTHEGCTFCPPGQVRSSVDGQVEGPCVPAVDFCDAWQDATDGKCSDCLSGKVSEANDNTMELTHEACVFCKEGYVRSSADGTALGLCVPAGDYCESWQFAIEGKCRNCTTGQESSRDTLDLFTYEYCQYCPDGQVRSSKEGDAFGPCVSAVGFCDIYERAFRGRCTSCDFGQSASLDADNEPDHISCFFCPIGEVRSSRDGLLLGPCVPAERYCEVWEFAAFGKCNTCERGQTSTKDDFGNTTYKACQFCPSGQVRNDAGGRGEGPCQSAVGICAENQRALKGQCINCIDGELSSVDTDGNFNHLSCGA